jgi:L-alanine-DL-glutamate epimerase-like enolase superfamily enzyme
VDQAQDFNMATNDSQVPIDSLKVNAYSIPTEAPESDGTLEWSSTTLILVEIHGGGQTGIGYSYSDVATARLIRDKLATLVEGRDALNNSACWWSMAHAIRNLGRPGLCSMAIAAVDNALWDLKAKLIDLPLVRLLGQVRDRVPIYGSGGFTSYDLTQLQQQLGAWAAAGMRFVKMKVGREPQHDLERVRAAWVALVAGTELFVDANGAYTRKQALAMAEGFAQYVVTWFEEPVTSDDLAGMRLIRDRAPAAISISSGEYGFDLTYFRRLLDAGAVDVLQADATRCAGITGYLSVGTLCQAYHVPLSSHTAPTVHLHPDCALQPVVHLEYFYDHARIEQMLFDGAPQAHGGHLAPDLSRPGLGVEFKYQDAERYAV